MQGSAALHDFVTMVKSGFLDTTAVTVGGARIVPMEFTAALLASQAQFQYARGEQDMAFIRVDVRGIQAGEGLRVVLDLVDHGDPATGFTAVQRTVGFTLAVGARLILENKLPRRGLLTPLDVPCALVFPALERYGMRVVRADTAWAIPWLMPRRSKLGEGTARWNSRVH